MRKPFRETLSTAVFCSALLAGCASRHPPAPTTGVQADGVSVRDAILRNTGAGDALLIGAGDIAACDEIAHAKATAAVIALYPEATVFTAGDDAYENGTAQEFSACYDPAWGSFKERTRPAPGNHDYGIYLAPPRYDAVPYFDYFGANAGPRGVGHYSYDLGSWHIVSLDSMAGQPNIKAPTMSDQVEWLKHDLEGNERRCILAYWHHPLWSSGPHGDQANDPGRSTGPLWDVLLAHKATLVVNGHDHHYERFAPQDARGMPDPQGIREFIVGTGGGEDRGLGTTKANSEVRAAHLYGVLLLTLHPTSYEWHFLNADGSVGDSSQEAAACN